MQRIHVEPYAQVGKSGCVTACLANVARKHLGEDIRPIDVDTEHGRDPEGDITGFERDVWLLRRKLPLRLIIGHNPTGIDDYINGDISFDTLLSNIATSRHSGNIDLVRKHYDNAPYREYVDRQARQKRELQSEFDEYEKSGQLIIERRQPELSDFDSVSTNGQSVLYVALGSRAVAHHELAYGSDNYKGTRLLDTYSPDLTEGQLCTWSTEDFSKRSIYLGNLAIVG